MCLVLHVQQFENNCFRALRVINLSATSGNKEFKRNHITKMLPAKRHQMWCKPQRDDSLKQVILSPTAVPYYYQAAVYTSF